jgi:Bacteriophage minor capsid protein
MNYIKDVKTYLTMLLTIPITLENWQEIEGNANQVCIMSEPGSSDPNSPIMTVNWGVYVRHKDQGAASGIADQIFAALSNYKGSLDPGGTNVFQLITCTTPPYYYSGDANTPIYLIRFKALVIEQSIKTTQKY